VTDSLGPDAGDEVLRNVASRLGEIVRPGDTVARFGSHEFAVIVESPPSSPHDSGEAHVLADRIIAELAQPVKLGDQQITLSVNVGIAFGGGNATADELSRNVVAANRDAKASGRNSYRVFEASMRAAALRRLQLTGDLRGGLDSEQFRLQYQPHVTMATGAVEGFEALVRWVHPPFGVIPPLDFMPLAEESGLIVPLGRWILEEACHRAASWPHPAGYGRRQPVGPPVPVEIDGRRRPRRPRHERSGTLPAGPRDDRKRPHGGHDSLDFDL
jgi:diguanylate cyclase (GGDEF)-like protein